MMFKKAFLPALIIFLLPHQANARNYSVEAIIFNHVIEDDTAVVEWDENAPRNIRAQTRLDRFYREAREAEKVKEEAELLAAETAPLPLEDTQAEAGVVTEEAPIETVVINELLELQTLHDRLVQSPDHEILQVLSWQQSEANYQDSPLVPVVTEHMMGVLRVYAPNLLFTELNLLYVPNDVLEEHLALAQAEGDIPLPIPEPEPIIETSFASFSFDPNGELLAIQEPVEERYFIDEQRKLKLNEIHYFDHPRFGVILMVKPLEEKEPEEATQE